MTMISILPPGPLSSSFPAAINLLARQALTPLSRTAFVRNRNCFPPPPIARSDRYLSNPETQLTITVAILGLIALVLESLLLKRVKHLQAEETLRVFALTLIVIGTLFFVCAGFSAQQIAPAVGLFGTVVGYLLGQAAGKGEKSNGETEKT